MFGHYMQVSIQIRNFASKLYVYIYKGVVSVTRIYLNSQSLEDTQVGAFLKNTLWINTLWKNTLWKNTLWKTFKIFKFGKHFEIWSKF